MFKPHVPVNPTPTGEIIPVITTLGQTPTVHHAQAPAPCACHHPHAPATAPAALARTGMSPGTVIALAAAGTVGVVVIGVVLVSMLLAVVLVGASLAVVALALRSALTPPPSQRR
ncbi:SpdD-like protein [Streptomyces sp. TRM66268-LWL]|uniref:SpdD-like protein n=1 Tax=Streptomyces polyasparticus TaxID=2767826 RepID=A0ABR7SVF6_9ACTN|nr:SpdD-like protein [Streptomyces polyasparticus]MBC9719475.1 SpdD-like protein [Streptomyces polyasparticus]